MRLIPLALLVLSPAVFAQAIPDAGSQLRQLPPTPAIPTAQPQIRIEETPSAPAADAGSDAVKVRVDRLRITGTSIYPEAELVAISGFVPGSQYTLAQLNALAERISEHYRAHGYFVARAYLPAQDVSAHAVTIDVSEGHYGQVTLRNSSGLHDNVARSRLRGLNSGDAIRIEPLESRLLRLSDIPGVAFSSTLVPGAAPGTSDLVVDAIPGRRFSGSIDADNAGNPYTGENRVGATFNVNDPTGLGDQFTLRLLTSGNGLRYGRAAYQLPLGPAIVGVAYSRLDYRLGKQFAVLGAHGSADVATVFASTALVRSRDANLYAGLAYEGRNFNDRSDLFGTVTDKHADVGIATLRGDRHDTFNGGGTNTFYVALSAGTLDIRTPAARAIDASTARTQGGYGKLAFNIARTQRVTDVLSLRAGVSGQVASKNLDPSEKLVLGGIDAVRGYPQGEGFGDEGFVASAEAALLLTRLSERVPGQVHLLAFVDAGSVRINKDPWFVGDNQRSLQSAGVGVTWDSPGSFAVRAYYAGRLGGEMATSAPDKSGRFWIQGVKYF